MPFYIIFILLIALSSCRNKTTTTAHLFPQSQVVESEDLPLETTQKAKHATKQTYVFESEAVERSFTDYLQVLDNLPFALSYTPEHASVFVKAIPKDTATIVPVVSSSFLEETIIPTHNYDTTTELHLVSSLPAEVFNFERNNGIQPYTMSQPSSQSIVLEYDADAPLSENSLVLSQKLNDFAHKYPAQFYGALGNVIGLQGLIQRTERVLSGVVPQSPQSLAFRYKKNEANTETLALSFLPFFASRYFRIKENKLTTYTWRGLDTKQPRCQKITLQHLLNEDPLISLSTGKANGALLFRKENIAIAQRRLHSFALTPAERIYGFLAMNSTIPKALIAELQSPLGKKKMSQTLTFETHLATDSRRSISVQSTQEDTENSPKALRCVYSAENPMATETANYLKRVCEQLGIAIVLDGTKYEEHLFNRNFDIAVGFMAESAFLLPGAESYMGRYWFDGESSRNDRIAAGTELPLFMAQIYLAAKPDIVLPKNALPFLGRLDESKHSKR